MRTSVLGVLVAVCAIGFGVASRAQAGEKYVLYKMFDMAKNCTLEIKPQSEFRKLQAELNKEASLFPRALRKAEEEWTKNKDKDEKGSFPRTLVAPREVKEIDTFATQEDAQKKLSSIEDRDRPSDKDKKNVRQPSKEEKEREAKKAQREADRKSKAETVAMMVDTQLKELMAAARGEAGEKKEEGKKEEPKDAPKKAEEKN